MLAQLTAPEHNVLTGVKTFKWWSLKPEDRNRKVLLSTDTGDPLIMDRPLGANGGYVVLWATPVDGGAWNNWPSEKLFAPLVNETLYHLAGGQIKGMENRRLESGDKIVWTGPAKPVVQKVEVTRPDGTKAERHPFTRDGRQVLVYGDTDLPGKYELRFDQSAIAPVYYGVGINRNELDETPLSDADRAWLRRTRTTSTWKSGSTPRTWPSRWARPTRARNCGPTWRRSSWRRCWSRRS